MKPRLVLLALFLVTIAISPAGARELQDLKVLYVGSERGDVYLEFLKNHVSKIDVVNRADFKPEDAAPYDVVLLDWPQGPETREMRKLTSPLGKREGWNKPTVLIGSAGLNLAVSWKMKGGSGCTCMDPLAYGLRDHEIFERPFKIDRSQVTSIPTPPDFQQDIKEPTIEVLPLVSDRDQRWKAGWCTYSDDFALNPDVEYFCGGVNHKTPSAAGLWRQGNLLHFGFEQSPAEMNERGQQLLLNSIAYISRFNEDRPIAVTPSVFAGPVARRRATIARWLRNDDYKEEWVKDLVAPAIWEEMSTLPDREQMAKWAEQNAWLLHPNDTHTLELDQDLAALGVPFDQPEFFDKTIAALRSKDAVEVDRAHRLLHRYAPIGPQNATADEWAAWWTANRPYLFASDSSDYCWYIDPLAKKRKIPSRDLRGPDRADQTEPAPKAS